MAKEFTVLNVDAPRGCMLVRFTDGPRQHETEVPLPPVLPAGAGDADVAEWIKRFWPHSQMEALKSGAPIAITNIVGKAVDITADVPAARDTIAGKFPAEPPE